MAHNVSAILQPGTQFFFFHRFWDQDIGPDEPHLSDAKDFCAEPHHKTGGALATGFVTLHIRPSATDGQFLGDGTWRLTGPEPKERSVLLRSALASGETPRDRMTIRTPELQHPASPGRVGRSRQTGGATISTPDGALREWKAAIRAIGNQTAIVAEAWDAATTSLTWSNDGASLYDRHDQERKAHRSRVEVRHRRSPSSPDDDFA